MADGEALAIQSYAYSLGFAYSNLAATILLWYDISLTFHEEVQRIWKRKITGASLSYLIIRYLVPLYYMMRVLHLILALDIETCSALYYIQFSLVVVKDLGTAVIVILRAYGISGRNWKLVSVIAPVALYGPVWDLLFVADIVPSASSPPVQFKCLYDTTRYASLDGIVNSGKTWIIPYVLSGSSEAMLLLLTWYKTFSVMRYSRGLRMKTPLSILLIRDGTLYFLLVFASTAVIVYLNGDSVDVTGPLPYILEEASDVVSCAVLARFLLNLRGLYFAGSGGTSDVPTGGPSQFSTSLLFGRRFDTYVVGNLGATVRTDDQGRHGRLALGGEGPGWLDEGTEEEAVYCDDPFKEGMIADIEGARTENAGRTSSRESTSA